MGVAVRTDGDCPRDVKDKLAKRRGVAYRPATKGRRGSSREESARRKEKQQEQSRKRERGRGGCR